MADLQLHGDNSGTAKRTHIPLPEGGFMQASSVPDLALRAKLGVGEDSMGATALDRSLKLEDDEYNIDDIPAELRLDQFGMEDKHKAQEAKEMAQVERDEKAELVGRVRDDQKL
jgi:hypothetical protein